MMRKTHISEIKVQEVARIESLLDQFKVVGLARLNKVPAKALHNLRDTLRGDVVITMSKKKLIHRAFTNSGKGNLEELANQIQGITALIFTNMNPIKLAQYLESKAVKGPAKPGDIAPIDILVKAGDTKLAPGPIISELNQNLHVPTLIKNGTIHIRTDKVTHHVGDLIDAKQSQLLARLGVEPMTIKLDFYSAWENGELIPEDVLHLDVEEILGNVRLAASQAFNLSMGIGFLTKETVEPLVSKAAREAHALAMELPIFIPELLDSYVAKAVREAKSVNVTVFGSEAEEEAEEEEKSEAEKEVQKDDDEEMGGGIANLFG
ncbi:MAG: 50S ribosomal protein L10 [Promethearchaeota archaeon]